MAAPANARKTESRSLHRSSDVLICAALILSAMLVFSGTLNNDFVYFDDDGYVQANPSVRNGLSADAVRYAFTTLDLGNWIPLTWLSYELDVSLRGLRPEVFHQTDLLLHVLNMLLIYAFLRTTTGALGRSAVVAAIWGLHPLRVESVAWIAERKDVLSTFFMLLAMICYARYVRNGRWFWYAAVVLMLLSGLMAKPMLVTLPILLFGLDVWPLQRGNALTADQLTVATSRTIRWRRQFFEKGPLLLISLGFGLIAIRAQESNSALVSLEVQPLLNRVLHAVEAYGWYLQKTALPLSLGPFYPLDPTRYHQTQIWIAVIAVTGVGGTLIFRYRTRPWIFFGAFWFLTALLPVIGIVQVGGQAYADRYSYVPAIGLMILVVWELNDWLSSVSRNAGMTLLAAAAVLSFMSAQTCIQVEHWSDARSLWTHALALNSKNWLAHFHMGRLALRENDQESAIEHFTQCLEQQPGYADAHLMLAGIYQYRQDWQRAGYHYRAVLAIQPNQIAATFNLGTIARSERRFDESRQLLESCLGRPEYFVRIQMELGHLAVDQGKPDLGLTYFDAATNADPQLEMGYEFAAVACEQRGQPNDAIARLNRGLRELPHSPRLRIHLAQLLYAGGQNAAALEHLNKVSELNPDNAGLRKMIEAVKQSVNLAPAVP